MFGAHIRHPGGEHPGRALGSFTPVFDPGPRRGQDLVTPSLTSEATDLPVAAESRRNASSCSADN